MSLIKLVRDRNLWMFLGSGLIVSVAYMDPGNWGTNIAGGSTFNYALLWAIWMASGMAMLFQYLSGKIGIAGYSLPELIKEKFNNKKLVLGYWILAEIAILATDLAEFLGIVVALNLLFGIPLLLGSFISLIEILLFFYLTRKNFRVVEISFIILVSIIGLGFLYELFITKPDFHGILLGSVIPVLNSKNILVIVGIIGATIMPHALFIHSWLIKNKYLQFKITDKKKLLKYHLFDNVVSLIIAACVNAAMLIMAAAAFYQTGTVATLSEAYTTLIPLFGTASAIIFGIALLAAGISSSITGTLAGQSLMDGLTDFRISPFVRRLITRFVNMIPLTIAIILGVEPLDILVYSQVLLSLLIPLPLIPILIYSADKKIMGELVNNKSTTIIAWTFATIVLMFNCYLLFTFFLS